MREILFKGKDVNGTHEWRTGYFCTLVQGSLKVIGNGVDWCQVYSETVGQYTGLTDKNGTKIFEGDIVKTKYGRWCQVIWFSSPRGQRWNLIPLEDKHKCPDNYDLWTPKNLEVIGNVHDNLDLIKA